MATAIPGELYGTHLNCPICMEMFTDPRALPCLHTFCLKCLHSYITSLNVQRMSATKGFECPVCRTINQPPFRGLNPYSWAENYPSNYAVKGLIEVANNQIAEDGERNDRMEGNEIQRETGNASNSMKTLTHACDSHPDRTAQFLCEDHSLSICTMCAARQHRTCVHVTYLDDIEDSEIQTDMNRISKTRPATLNVDQAKKHKSLIRLSKSVPFKGGDHPTNEADEKLTDEFAHARLIGGGSNGETDANPNENTSHQALQRSPRQNRNVDKIPEQQPTGNETVSFDNLQIENIIDARRLSGTSLEVHTSLNDILEEDENPSPPKIDQNISKSQISSKEEIYIRVQSDRKSCSVTGITSMPDGRIVLTDENNKNIKMFDILGNNIACLDLPSEPWDIDTIEQFEAVVTFPTEKCIRIILIDEHNSMTIVRTIAQNRKCYGVAYHKHEFWIAMENEVRIVSYEGVKLNKITKDTSWKYFFSKSATKTLFSDALYIAIDSRNNDTVYISDAERGHVVSLDRKRNVIATFRTGDAAGRMLGLSICPNGKVFVCQSPKSLMQVSVDEHGSRSKVLVELDNIQAVHYVTKNNTLWVTKNKCNFVTVYQLKGDMV